MIVCIAEKPSVAKDIAHVLGANSSHDGVYEGNGYQGDMDIRSPVYAEGTQRLYAQLETLSLAALPDDSPTLRH